MPFFVVPTGTSSINALSLGIPAGASWGSALTPRVGLGDFDGMVRMDFEDTPGEIEAWGTATAMAEAHPTRIADFRLITVTSAGLMLPGDPLV